MYTVKKSDLKGKIADFPIEVVQKMVDEQVAQGNRPNVEIFQKKPQAEHEYRGFDWNETFDDSVFWNDVINNKKFNIFFAKYPKNKIISKDKNEVCKHESLKEKDEEIVENAVIKNFTINREDGWLTIGLTVEYDNGVQSMHFNFQDPEGREHFSYKGTAGYFLLRVLQICDVIDLKNIIGQSVRVKHTQYRIIAVGNFLHEDWFDPQKDLFDKVNAEDEKHELQDNVDSNYNCYSRSDLVQFCKFVDKVTFSFALLRNVADTAPVRIIFLGINRDEVRKYLYDNKLLTDEKIWEDFEANLKDEWEYYALSVADHKLIWCNRSKTLEPIVSKELYWNMKLKDKL